MNFDASMGAFRGALRAARVAWFGADPVVFSAACDRAVAAPAKWVIVLLGRGRLVSERMGDDTSIGATKFYRVSCFKAIGGFVREVMWDGIDCHRCRMKGQIACSWNDPELRFVHLRPMGSSQQSVYVGPMRHGAGQYFMGTGFLCMAASAASRLSQKPYVLGSLAMLWGWLRSALERRRRLEDPGFRRALRAYQGRVLLVGKKRALTTMQGFAR